MIFEIKDYLIAERAGFHNLIGKSVLEIIHADENNYVQTENHLGTKYAIEAIPYVLKLSDGNYYGVYTNEGCGGCANGWAKILHWNDEIVDNVITNVEWEETEDDDIVNVFIFYDEKRINMAMVDEGYGNNWYGGGIGLSLLELVT